MITQCPCKSGFDYKHCCEPFHLGHSLPPQAQLLMRSRYCAFVVNDCHYIFATHSKITRHHVSQQSITQWNEQCQWLGLDIIRDYKEGDDHIVEFVAWFKQDNLLKNHHEISRFSLQTVDDELDNRITSQSKEAWYYVDATYPTQSINMPSRNDMCVCKSGKKYKKCCG